MSSASLFETLRQHRPLLLACEAMGWLHMTGKAKADFLRTHGGQPNDYKYERWFQYEKPPFPWSDLLQWVKDNYPLDQNAWPGSLTDFIEKHTGKGPGLLGLLQAGHGMASGIEKNIPRATSEYLNQDATQMWLTSPFGHPLRNLLADPPEILTEQGWHELLRKIQKLLEDLQALGSSDSPHTSNDLEGWWQWREDAIGPSGWLRQAFLSTLAETRIPNNDVTLWDQCYVAAALFKAAVAGAVLVGPSFNWQDSTIKQQTRWRVLTVGFGTDHYEARAVKIGDWVGARHYIDRFFEKVRRLIEVNLALGSLVFQDEETLAFTFPGLRLDATADDSKGSLDDGQAKALRGEIEREIDGFARKFQLETPPLCQLSESTRSFVPMVRKLREARKQLAIPIHRAWDIPNTGSSSSPGTRGARHVCPVCQVRLNEPRADDQTDNVRKSRPCRVCGERRRGRLDAWLSGEQDTIWITELADENDRVALLTFSLDIEPWLEGKHVDSLRTQSIPEWRRFNPVLQGTDNPIDSGRPFQALCEYICSKLSSFDKRDPVLKSLQDGYPHESEWKSFYKKLVEDRADAPEWDAIDDELRARWLVHQLFCKLPSPGRIYRFWRSAEAFFDELFHEFRDIASAHENRWRTRRLLVYADSTFPSQGWEDRETYSGRFGDGPLELLYLKDKQAFVTICNLARCLRAEQSTDELRAGGAIGLRAEEEQKENELKVTRVEVPDRLGTYTPILLLDRSPSRFRVLVPLDRATACIEAAIAKWKEEFSRVWDRMPLRIGVVAFPRMIPFQAIIEAARNLEVSLAKGSEETWTVRRVETRERVTALVLDRELGGQDLVTVPVRLRDGREDVFYPYVRVAHGKVRNPRDFQHPNGQVFRHIADLRAGDGIHVWPSRIGAMFLDTTGRRFEKVAIRYLSEFERMRDAWRVLRDLAPSITALRGAWAELEERDRQWRDANGKLLPGADEQWLAFARAVLHDRLQMKGAALDTLVASAKDGTLGWALEWHLTWLKERLGGTA